MKTSVNMIRKMGSFEVVQRTKDGMFNASNLLKQWNYSSGQQKKVAHFFENKETVEFLKILHQELGVQNGRNSDLPDKQVVSKSNAKTNSQGVRTAGAVWMHPYLFIDFAMWLNPRFKYQVIKFVYDQLIEQRKEAGNMYKTLSNAAKQLRGVDYRRIAKGLNYIVFGYHESGTLRQIATKEQLRELSEAQNKLAFAVDMGYIKTFQELIDEMKKMHRIKWSRHYERAETTPVLSLSERRD